MQRRESSSEKNRIWLYFGALGLTLLSKLKVIVPLVSKLALPVFTMLASIGAYAWYTRSWEIALGLVAMIFVHETGHVLAARRKGLPVTLPIFLPFLGAFIAMKRNPRDALTEAYIALGGPVLGTAGALAAYGAGLCTGSLELVIIAYFGAFINLLNLLPIHPLDGGRIAAAVSRRLWFVGLTLGLVVIIYLRSIVFFVIWAMFAWELYTKYVARRKRGSFVIPFQIQIPISYFRMQGAFIPGEQHQRELAFTTYSELGGDQKVEIWWDSIGVREQLSFQRQMTVKSVKVIGTKHQLNEQGELAAVYAQCELSGRTHENDRYYDVPATARWAYGSAYAGLAVLLIWLMMSIHGVAFDKFPGKYS